MSALSAYHSANYYSKCPQESQFLSSWLYLVYPLHYSNVFFIPMVILAGYCILFKTPKAMQPMKWVYFNLHAWIFFQSVYVSLLVTPYVWVPTFSGSFLGLLGKIGVSDVLQAYVGCNTLIVSMSATVSLFENRHQQIQRNRLRLTSRALRYSIQAFNYLYAILYPFPVYRDIPDQTEARFAVLKAIPCPFEDFFSLPFYAFSIDPLMQTYFAISLMIGLLITISQLIFYSSTCLYYLVFKQPSHSSRVTNTRQKKFFLGILVQISIPYALMSPGMMYVSWSMLSGYYSQKLNNLAFLILGTYGLAATLALLLIHSPYREFVKQLIGFDKKTSNQGSAVGDKRGVAFASV